MKVAAVLIYALIFGLSTAGGVDRKNGNRLRGSNFAHSSETSQALSSSSSSKPRNVSEFVKPEHPPAYFAIDVDGTLYTSNQEVMKRNVEAFAEVKKKGYTPFICTGRAKDSALQLIGGNEFKNETGYEGNPGVYKNGAIVYDEHGKVLTMHAFPESFLKTLHSFLTAKNLLAYVMFYDEEGAFVLVQNNEVVKHLTPGKYVVPKLISLDDLLKKNILMIKYSDFNFEVDGLRENVDYVEKNDLNGTHDLSPPGVTKAIGIMKLMEHFNAKPEDCGFIGDGDNDVEAMDQSRISFAIGNAPDDVKKHAKWVMDKKSDEGGVAEALKLTYGLLNP